MRLISRRFQVLLTAAAGLTALILLTGFPQHSPHATLLNHPYFHYNLSAEEPKDPAQTCVIPRIHPFHRSIWRFITDTRPIRCKARIPSLTFIDDYGWLRVNRTAFDEAGYTLNGGSFMKTLQCHWQPILRGGADNTNDNIVTYGSEVTLTANGFPLSDVELIRVKCQNFAGVSVYENIHAHIRNITSFHRHSERNQNPLNVLIIGLDSLSRQAFMRLMPKSYRYLTEVLSVYVLHGMNKVGDNTFPNLIALLTGRAAYGPDLPVDASNFDEWPLVWKNFSAAGYATLWAEDFPDYGLFNYLAKGFTRPPVQHYLRPFWLAVKVSSTLRTSSHMCFGNIPRHTLQLDYVRRFVEKYGGNQRSAIPYFGFSFLAELSHEYLARVAAADGEFESLFKVLKDDGHLNNTLLIVMSDHGHRFDEMRSTQVGRLEERLPFFAMHVPKGLLSNEVKRALKTNVGRLTTPYDVYATLVDVLNHVTTSTALGTYVPEFGHGRTLFGVIPSNRTCSDAGIPPHYCTCEPEIPISVEDLKVREAVRMVFNRINRMLKTVKQLCAELLPGEVISAQVLNANSDAIANPGRTTNRIRVTVRALPSDAIFESTVEITDVTKNAKSESALPYDAKVLGDISRINKYGKQSSCIRHEILRKYCFCAPGTER